MRDGWTTVYGNHVMVANNRATWALDRRGHHADIYVGNDIVNGQLTITGLRKLLKEGKATIR